jgi:hypothetical protein
MDELRDAERQIQQAYGAYITLQNALHTLPADHPATPGLAKLVIVAAQHWHAMRAAAESGERDDRLVAVAPLATPAGAAAELAAGS